MSTLRERAEAAARDAELLQQELDAEAIRQQQARDAKNLKDLLSRNLGIDANPTGGVWSEDEVEFHVIYSRDCVPSTQLVIVQKCPDCDSNLISHYIDDLGALGRALRGDRWQYHEHYRADGNPDLDFFVAKEPTRNPDDPVGTVTGSVWIGKVEE